jgi:hypothetical protein
VHKRVGAHRKDVLESIATACQVYTRPVRKSTSIVSDEKIVCHEVERLDTASACSERARCVADHQRMMDSGTQYNSCGKEDLQVPRVCQSVDWAKRGS